MRVDELRTELMARDLDTRGLKNQLMLRLKEALDNEKVFRNLFFNLRKTFLKSDKGKNFLLISRFL